MSISQRSEERVAAFSRALSGKSTVGFSTSSVADITDLVVALEDADEVADVEILTDSDTVIEQRKLFLTTSRLVDYVLAGTLTVHAQEAPLQSLIITEDAVGAVAGFREGNPAVAETTDESAVAETVQAFEERFDGAEEVTFRTPGYATLLEELEETSDKPLVEDFKDGLEAAKDAEQPAVKINPVYVSLLVGGYNEASFYRLSRWGETAQVGSPANFSRKKQKLEELNLIETEQIPSNLGRRRQRLLLGDALEAETIEGIVDTAIDRLTKNG